MEEWLGVVVYFLWAIGKSMNDRFLVIHDVCILSLCLSLSFENYMAG